MMVDVSQEFRHLQCSECAINYYFPEKWCKTAHEKKLGWKCPNGHGQVFGGETEATKLRRERDRLAQRIAEKDDEIKSLEGRRRAAVGQITKIKNRVGHGVCPCCNRTFENLARHMTSKHPTFTAEAAE